MGENQDEALSKFLQVTAATDAQARFFLESANWELDAALVSFFEASDEGVGPSVDAIAGEDEDEEMSVPAAAAAAGGGAQGGGRGGSWPAVPTGSMQGQGPFPGSKAKGKDKGSSKKGSSSRSGGITTLSDLNRQADSDEDSDGPQEYYTGGEKSGMMVQDPTKRGPRDVDAMFDRVRQSGAREGMAEPHQPAAAAASNRGVFSGASRTLNGEPRQQERPAPAPLSAGGSAARSAPEPVFHTITFWRNGFTVDDGPLRRLDDPANEPFLDSINKSECPRELEPADRNTPVHVSLVKKDEEWKAPPEPKYVAFRGTGRTLGSGTSVPAAEAASPATLEAANQPFQGLIVDEAKPSTSIQLRLLDGTRMVARFNHTHTISDIRGFIDAARPGNVGSYSLQTMGFPPKQLTDLKQTIEAAGLINAVVIQKG